MPPKRGRPNKESEQPSKKLKARDNESPEPEPEESDANKQLVRWALPTQDNKSNQRDESDGITRYAQPLFDQPWDGIRTNQRPFKFPALRIPIFKGKGKDIDGADAHRSNAVLRGLWNEIKHATEPPSSSAGSYAEHRFQTAFSNTPGGPPVVASRSTEQYSVFSLDQDYQVEVTIREGDRTERAHVNFIRRATPNDDEDDNEHTPADSEYGYFIELPPGGRVTVNNRTYHNEIQAEDDASTTALPFIIGPLNRFTIVELFSQSIFFFRVFEDMKHESKNVLTGTNNTVTQVELDRRDTHGDVDTANVEVVWTSLHLATVNEPHVPPANESVEGQNLDVQNLDVQDLDGENQNDQSRNEQNSGEKGTGEKSPEESSSDDSSSTPPRPPGLDEGLLYDDGWAVEGKPIGNAHEYYRDELQSFLRDRQQDTLIPRVLASINDRQIPQAGFSIDFDDHVLRPGRTLITNLQHPDETHQVIIIVSIHPGQPVHNITIHVLDVTAWRTTKEERQTIHGKALELLRAREWWQGTFQTVEAFEAALPAVSMWVDCAQDVEGGDTLAFLSAFALALGLILEPAFRIEDAEAIFHNEAQVMFETALSDRLDWRLLYAFLSSNRFTRGTIHSPEGETATRADNMPPSNRKFDLRIRPFSRLIAQQRASDAATTTRRSVYDIQIDATNANVALDPGVAHSNDFPSDLWTEEFREGIAREVVRRGNWTLSSTEDDVKSEYRGLSKSPEGSQTQSNDLGHANNTAIPAEPTSVPDSGSGGGGHEPVTDPTQSDNNQTQPDTITTPDAETDLTTVGEDATQPSKIPIPMSEPAASHLEHDDVQLTATATTTETSPKIHEDGETQPDTSQALSGPSIDHDPLPDDFDACAHLQKRLEELDTNGNNADEPTNGSIDHATALDSIASVVQALQELFPPAQSTTLTSQDGVLYQSSDANFDPVIIHLHRVGEHVLLVLIQGDKGGETRPATVHVVDSLQRTPNLQERRKLYDEITAVRNMFNVELPETFRWIFGPVQMDPYHSPDFACLNAWSILLDLEINTDGFAPHTHFFRDARRIFRAARRGNADWKLIWSFLRCHKYVTEQHVPALERRFTKTISADARHDHTARLAVKQPPNPDQVGQVLRYGRSATGLGLPHNAPLPQDDLEKEDIEIRIPALRSSGVYRRSLSKRQIRNLYGGKPKDFEACTHFREWRDRWLEDATNRANLEDFRQRAKVTRRMRKWLDDTEVSLAIASVTLALTRSQPVERGFGFMIQPSVQICAGSGNEVCPVSRTIRPGRPMLLPLHIHAHFILLILRFNNDSLETLVMDSKGYYLPPDQRRLVHQGAYKIARDAEWSRHVLAGEFLATKRPRQTYWLPCSSQPSDDECAYYTILNAWALALGLEPDPAAHIDWDDQFFRDLLDIIHLARTGKVNWLLIYSFLRCYRFVHQGEVSQDRRFKQTVDLQTDNATETIVDDIGVEDTMFFEIDKRSIGLQELEDASRLSLPIGVRRQHTAFDSDSWNDKDRFYAAEASRRGYFDSSISKSKLKERFEASQKYLSSKFHRGLQQADPEWQSQSREKLSEACREFLHEWFSTHQNLMKEAPCEIIRDTVDFYNKISQPKSLGSVLPISVLNNPNHKLDMEYEEVNLSLSAVVEAIDRIQSEMHTSSSEDTPFAGGLSLSTSTRNTWALADQTIGSATRPRRCFLMPMLVTSDHVEEIQEGRIAGDLDAMDEHAGEGHYLLVAIEERNDVEGHQFQVTLYDSTRRVFEASELDLCVFVEQAVQRLEWTSHRNPGNKIPFRGRPHIFKVPQQKGGGWQCGPHTVINGWILAMGLTPRETAVYNDTVYQQFRTIARAAVRGVLSWTVLVTWFFCHNLTTERDMKSVASNRRFRTTSYWTNEASLEERMDDIAAIDEVLGTFTLEQVPYDTSNNPSNVVEGEGDGNEDEDDDEGLHRQFEDPGNQAVTRRNNQQRYRYRDTDPLIFLDGYARSGQGTSKHAH